MKWLKLIAIVLLCVGALTPLQAQSLAGFNLNNYKWWIYTRADVKLNTQNISRKKIKLYRSSGGDDYMLKSPFLDCSKARFVRVEFDYWTENYNQPTYSLAKSTPIVELIDMQGKSLVSKPCVLDSAQLMHKLVVFLEVPLQAVSTSLRVQFSAPDGDYNSNGAVHQAWIAGSATSSNVIVGDINGDDYVDVDDATMVVKMMLGILPVDANKADLNHDSRVDVSDVTALVNIILSR